MRFLMAFLMMGAFSFAQAADKIKMDFNNEEITKLIEIYSKASGQKFIMEANVRGKVSIFLPEPVTVEEAFNHLSSALALNGYAISKQGDTMIINSARNIQRDLIEVGTEVPSLKPERMYTWIYTFKYASANAINRDLRILSSKDGELTVSERTNQIVMTDWVSNIHRVAEIFKEVDKKLEPSVAKIVDSSKKDSDQRRKEQAAPKEKKE